MSISVFTSSRTSEGTFQSRNLDKNQLNVTKVEQLQHHPFESSAGSSDNKFTPILDQGKIFDLSLAP